MLNPHSRFEQDCMNMYLKIDVPHIDILVWGTSLLRCRVYRNYATGCIECKELYFF